MLPLWESAEANDGFIRRLIFCPDEGLYSSEYVFSAEDNGTDEEETDVDRMEAEGGDGIANDADGKEEEGDSECTARNDGDIAALACRGEQLARSAFCSNRH
jgi:hypothetical protein